MQTLFVITTPIGNLDDITIRAKETLNKLDVLFCEDTRVTSKLLALLNIKKPKLISINKFSEYDKVKSDSFTKLIAPFSNIGLVSDAGVPGLSDPGMILVNYAHKNKIKVVPISGISALNTLISISGIETKEFLFIGFLPHTKSKKQKTLENALSKSLSIIFYESPLRIQETIKILKSLNLDIEIVIGRELTKLHEQIIYSKLDVLEESSLKKKGEYAVLIQTKTLLSPQKEESQSIQKELAHYLGIPSKEAYKIIVNLKK